VVKHRQECFKNLDLFFPNEYKKGMMLLPQLCYFYYQCRGGPHTVEALMGRITELFSEAK